MSEKKERNMKHGAPVAAEDKTNAAAQAENVQDGRENAPAGEKAPVEAENREQSPEKKKAKKKRRKNGIPMALAAVLLVISLAFGIVAGYGVGRNAASEKLRDVQAQLDALTAAFEEGAGMQETAGDAFSEELSGENQAALEDLAGGAFVPEADAASALLDEDELGGSAAEPAEPAVVVAEYKGGKLMSDEVAREYSEQMTNFVFAGYNEDEIADTLLDEVLHYMVSDRILEAHAREMGLYELTQEDRARIEEEAERSFSEQLDFYRDYVNTDGMTEAEAEGAVKAYLQENGGVTLESIRAELENSWWAQKMYDEITGDAVVSDQDVQNAYDQLLARQKESFEAYPDDFEYAQMNGETIVYNLDGYRAVRMLLFAFRDSAAYEAVPVLTEEIGELNPETDAEMIAGYRAEIDGYYAPLEEAAGQALERLNGGESFASLLDELGEDAGMKDEALRKSGYYVSAQSLLWPAELIEAAMGLEKAGDISAPVRTGNGVCILEYVGEVTPGAVAFADVEQSLRQETLESARYSAYEAQVNRWLEEAGAVYYPERMQ